MKAFFCILFTAVLFQSCADSRNKKLPIFGNREPVERNENGKIVADTIYHSVAPFAFLNQDSVVVTDKDFNGKIYVADFFFTSCNTICPTMHRNMLKVYEKFKANPEVKILSHSIDIKYDVPSRLKKYAVKLGVTGTQWEFVHGNRSSIFEQATGDYLVAAFEDDKDPQGLVHQGWFMLVDKKKQLRGAYDGTKPDEVERLMTEMEILLKEE